MTVMEKLLKEERFLPRALRRGEVVEGVVLKKGKDDLLLDIGAKSEGLVSGNELEDQLGTFEKIEVGDSVLARVLRGNSKSGLAVLSLKEASGARKWRRLQKILEEQETLDVSVLGYNSGGLVVEILDGLEGFLPLSHLDWAHFPVKEQHRAEGEMGGKEAILSRLVGESLLVRIIELEPATERVVVSEKEALHDVQRAEVEKFWSGLEPGVRKHGVVTGIVPFGLFVRLEDTNVEGLVHVSEIAWGKVSHPGDLYEIGDKVAVKILSCDSEMDKVSLSIKALKDNPWEELEGRYKVGAVVSGEVTRITAFGAFVSLEDGIEGLIHISETVGPLAEGDRVKAKIIEFKPEEQRLGLSVRQIDKE